MTNVFPNVGIHAAFDALRKFPKVVNTIWKESKRATYGVCGIQRIDVDARKCEVTYMDLRIRIGLRSGKVLA